jgi:hypothetical protein
MTEDLRLLADGRRLKAIKDRRQSHQHIALMLSACMTDCLWPGEGVPKKYFGSWAPPTDCKPET